MSHYSFPRMAVINMLLQARQVLNGNVAINIVRGRNKPTCPGDISWAVTLAVEFQESKLKFPQTWAPLKDPLH